MQQPAPQYGYPPPYGYPPFPQVPPQSPEEELAALESYKEELEAEWEDLGRELEGVGARIKELKGMIESAPGAPPTGVPPTQVPPMVPPMPFMPPLTKEQEKQVLEQQVKAFEAQLDVIRKRLEELKGSNA